MKRGIVLSAILVAAVAGLIAIKAVGPAPSRAQIREPETTARVEKEDRPTPGTADAPTTSLQPASPMPLAEDITPALDKMARELAKEPRGSMPKALASVAGPENEGTKAVLDPLRVSWNAFRVIESNLTYVSKSSETGGTFVAHGRFMARQPSIFKMTWLDEETSETFYTCEYDGVMYREERNGKTNVSRNSAFSSFFLFDALNEVRYQGLPEETEIVVVNDEKKETVPALKLTSQYNKGGVLFNLYIDKKTGRVIRYEDFDAKGLVYRHDYLDYREIAKGLFFYTKMRLYVPRQRNDTQELIFSDFEVNGLQAASSK